MSNAFRKYEDWVLRKGSIKLRQSSPPVIAIKSDIVDVPMSPQWRMTSVRSSSGCCNLRSATYSVKYTAKMYIKTDKRVHAQKKDPMEATIRNTIDFSSGTRRTKRISRRTRTRRNMRRSPMRLKTSCVPSPVSLVNMMALNTSSTTVTITTTVSNQFHFQPSVFQLQNRGQPLAQTRRESSREKMMQNTTSMATKTTGGRGDGFAAMWLARIPIARAFNIRKTPIV
mmetsp:Transcript_126040/g.281633  ORF Transcript_126040/g.281633 Transcript_126040/m.281633 type:complete len:227 (+) Transcript_126040:215-895(+)